jgi:hypothetical protein
MVTKKALNAGRELVKVYNTITLEEIEESGVDARKLTGFDSPDTCCLCLAVSYDSEKRPVACYRCIYEKRVGCYKGENHFTFKAIKWARTSRQLLKAYRERGKYVSEIIKKLEKKYKFQ